VLPRLVRDYNDMVHLTTGMAPSRVTDSDVLAIWKRMEIEKRRVHVTKVKFSVCQYVRISKEKMMFVKGAKDNFSTEIIRIAKVIERLPRPILELEEFNETPIEGQFYQEELTRVRVSNRPLTRELEC